EPGSQQPERRLRPGGITCLPKDQIANKSCNEERDRKGNEHWMDRMIGNLRRTSWIHGCLQIHVDTHQQQRYGPAVPCAMELSAVRLLTRKNKTARSFKTARFHQSLFRGWRLFVLVDA